MPALSDSRRVFHLTECFHEFGRKPSLGSPVCLASKVVITIKVELNR